MKTVTIKNMVLGAGRTKIAVPLVAEDSDGLMRAAAQLRQHKIRLVRPFQKIRAKLGQIEIQSAQLRRRPHRGGNVRFGDDFCRSGKSVRPRPDKCWRTKEYSGCFKRIMV